MLVDAETLEPARDGFSRAFGEGNAWIKPELFESFVEITTTVVETSEEVENELRLLRHDVAERARGHGLAVLATGSHPTARGRVPLVPVERYRRLKATARAAALPAAGLRAPRARVHPRSRHLPAGVRGRLAGLPGLLAASANSPFWEGAESGRRSIRSQILLEMPTGGTPPLLRSWDDWEAATRGDSTRRHWDVWPRPEYGTLEVRVLDQPTSLRRTAELATEVQRIVQEAAGVRRAPVRPRRVRRARDRAGREGGGPEAERQLELGPADALREIAALTLR